MGWLTLAVLLVFTNCGWAGNETFTNLLVRGDAADKRGDVAGAMKLYGAAGRTVTNAPDLCILTKRYCDLMYDAPAPVQKNLATQALECARAAVKADAKSSTAHLCIAVCYVKNFPYVDNETKANWSKAIKQECETGIRLDPKQDVGYYLLGRWHFGVANMNFIYKGLVRLVYGGLPPASNVEAVKNFKQAIALAPGRIIHHAALAQVYEAIGDHKLERSELELCAKLKPVDRDDTDAQQEAAKRLAAI